MSNSIEAARTVMAVDDDEFLLLAIEACFNHLGYGVELRNNPQQALADLQQRRISVQALLTDSRMPGMTGQELARAVKGFIPDIPIVGVSGITEDWAGKSRRELGIDLILPKPFNLATIRRTIRFIETYLHIPITDRELDLPPDQLNSLDFRS